MRKPPLVLAYLLSLLAILMGVHLTLLMARDRSCREYERALLSRLLDVPPDSDAARNLRNEIQNFFDGDYTDCTATGREFGGAADKYLAIILALLTGAGVSAGVSAGLRERDLTDRLMDDAEDKP